MSAGLAIPHAVRRLLAGALACLALAGCPRERAQGVLAPDEPVQNPAEDAPAFSFKGCQVTPLAHFHVDARVLSEKHYDFGRESKYAPVDLALGWGRMSDSSVLCDIKVEQMVRFYRWQSSEMPIPAEEIQTHSANMHIVPADDAVRRVLARVRTGDVVTIEGDLVQLTGDDGWTWTSSLTRQDTGDGACELVFARRIDVR